MDTQVSDRSDEWSDERPPVDPNEPSLYVRRSAWLPELGPNHDHAVDAEMRSLRRASERFLPKRLRRAAHRGD
jgi:hypothetical protein